MKIRSGLTLVALAVFVAASVVAAQPVPPAPPAPPAAAEPAAPAPAAKTVWFTIKNEKTHKSITVYVGDPILVPPALEKGDEIFVAKGVPQAEFMLDGVKIRAGDTSFSIGLKKGFDIAVKAGAVAIIKGEGAKPRVVTAGARMVLSDAVVQPREATASDSSQQQSTNPPPPPAQLQTVSPSAP